MSHSRSYHSHVGSLGSCGSAFNQNVPAIATDYSFNNYNGSNSTRALYHDCSRNIEDYGNHVDYVNYGNEPSLKRKKSSVSNWEGSGRHHQPKVYKSAPSTYENNIYPLSPATQHNNGYTSTNKRDRSKFEDDDAVFMSRHEIERCSPSRKDGIDALQEANLRYSYCAYLQILGLCLDLPQTTVGTSMVLCHRFFIRRSHACNDRFLIATAALFLAAKSEETGRPLNDVVRASSEIIHKQDITILSYMLPVDWFEKYRERVIEAEQLLLTTLDFELNVQHPYAPLMSMVKKLGLSQSTLVNLALNLISEGVYRRIACWPV